MQELTLIPNRLNLLSGLLHIKALVFRWSISHSRGHRIGLTAQLGRLSRWNLAIDGEQPCNRIGDLLRAQREAVAWLPPFAKIAAKQLSEGAAYNAGRAEKIDGGAGVTI
jgi:hypothetical protein